MLIERRHDSEAHEPGANLKFHRKNGERFVVEPRTQSALSSGVTGIAAMRKNRLAVLNGRIARGERAHNWFAATHGTTSHRRQKRRAETEKNHSLRQLWMFAQVHCRLPSGAPTRTIRQRTPVPGWGCAPFLSWSITPKSTT